MVYIKNSITFLCFFLKATVFTPQVYYLISNSMVRQKGWILNEKKEIDDALKKQFHTSLCCVNFHLKITCFQATRKNESQVYLYSLFNVWFNGMSEHN